MASNGRETSLLSQVSVSNFQGGSADIVFGLLMCTNYGLTCLHDIWNVDDNGINLGQWLISIYICFTPVYVYKFEIKRQHFSNYCWQSCSHLLPRGPRKRCLRLDTLWYLWCWHMSRTFETVAYTEGSHPMFLLPRGRNRQSSLHSPGSFVLHMRVCAGFGQLRTQ